MATTSPSHKPLEDRTKLTGQPRAVFVRWRGTISPKMPAGAGHMGGGSRYMLVTEILEMKPVDEAGCAKA